MPAQRHEKEKVRERASTRWGAGKLERERARERASEHTHAVGREGGGGERAHARTHAAVGWGPLAAPPPPVCFFLPWACPMQIGLSQECCLFYLKSSLQSSHLPLFYFRGLFPSLSFSYRHFGLLFPVLTT